MHGEVNFHTPEYLQKTWLEHEAEKSHAIYRWLRLGVLRLQIPVDWK